MSRGVRIAGGRLRGAVLRVPVSARPTTGRVREALFSILGGRVDGARVLDLFAGSGALGIEALSRGASRLVAVESDRAACLALRANFDRLELADVARLLAMPVERALSRLDGSFDLVFADPPYQLDVSSLMAELSGVLAPQGLLVVERGLGSRFDPGPFVVDDSRTYGDTALDLLRLE